MAQTIVVTEFLSLDGVMEAPNEWNIPYVDETLGADIQGELDCATALLYGRTTYDAMAPARPREGRPPLRRRPPPGPRAHERQDLRPRRRRPPPPLAREVRP